MADGGKRKPLNKYFCRNHFTSKLVSTIFLAIVVRSKPKAEKLMNADIRQNQQAETPRPRTKKPTRIRRQNETRILDAALEVFSAQGFRGATIDQIADAADMSKPNVLYYFSNKEKMHRALLDNLLETWLDPLRNLNPDGQPLEEILRYVRAKLRMARQQPRESRLFANEILQGAPRINDMLRGPLKRLVEEKVSTIQSWIEAGSIAECDPRHLIFSIWATAQHYADFDAQIDAVLGDVDGDRRFEAAENFLVMLFKNGLAPKYNDNLTQ